MDTQAKQDRVDDLFVRAIELPVEQRGAFLREAWLDDGNVAAEVERLLAAHERAEQSTDLLATLPDNQRLFRTITYGPPDVVLAETTEQSEFGHGRSLAGKYLLQERIGSGSFGVVFRAIREGDSTSNVAVKVVERVASRSQVLLEAQVHGSLKHPNIVELLDYFIEDGSPIIVLEFASGGSLQSVIAKKSEWLPAEVHDLLWQIGSALEYAHKHGVVHRDLKPANVLIDNSAGDPRYLLSDFGVGRRDIGLQTRANIAGSFAFMAPEQLRGRATTQSDLWAVGVLGYQLLTGRLPFQGKSLEELHSAIEFSEPEPIPLTGDPLQRGLVEIINSLLRKELRARLSSATEITSQLVALAAPHNQPANASPAAKVRPATVTTLEQRLRWRYWLTALAALVPLLFYMASFGVVAAALYTVGLWVLTNARQRDKGEALRTAGGLALCAAAAMIAIGGYDWVLTSEQLVNMYVPPTGDEQKLLASQLAFVFDGLLMLIMAFAFGWLFIRLQRLRHDLKRLTIQPTSPNSDLTRWLTAQIELDPSNLSLRTELARALISAGDSSRAVVQAKLVLDRDPYNYDATLLIVTALLALAKRDVAERVRQHYLAVNPHCFELRAL